MRKIWKNLFSALIIVIISGGVAAAVTAYVMKESGQNSVFTQGSTDEFGQPARMTAYTGVAAENTDFTFAAEKTIHAVVHIQVSASVMSSRQQYFDPFDFFFGHGDRQPQQQRRQRVGSGSGVIISTDGYIITNNHVIDGADSINVTLNDKRSFTGKLIGADPTTDIALIKIEADDLRPIIFGDSEQLKVGEWVLAVGNPFNLNSTVTAGIVSAKGRSIMTGEDTSNKIVSFIQTDAAVNPGNSGGALVNTKGELVGINTAIYSETGNFAGYSFAVPVSIAGKIVSDLKKYGNVQRAMLGVTIAEPELVKKEKDTKIKVLEGAYVSGFAERSSAREAGVEEGDVITAVNGKKIVSPNDLQEQIIKFQPGDKVKITVDRYGDAKTFTVELRNMQGTTEVMKGGDTAKLLGAAFKPLGDKSKREYGISYGIEVADVSSGKVRDCGIKKGFVIMIVNDEKVNTPEEFYSIVDKILKGNTNEKGLLIKGFYPNTNVTRHYAIDLVD
ncbi:MAG: Do family serine endopeptidase [Tannerella sp.]|jgi:Do/DeqQ family serine protease|nr:Do family serine endopeptidase [Tannerella sp.]